MDTQEFQKRNNSGILWPGITCSKSHLDYLKVLRHDISPTDWPPDDSSNFFHHQSWSS